MKFLKHMAAVFSGNMAFSISSFVVAAILVSKVGLEKYGLFVVLQACFQTWALMSKPMTWQAIVKFQDAYSMSSLLRASIKLELTCFAGASALILAIYGGLVWWQKEYIDYLYLVLVGVMVAPLYSNGSVVGYFRSTRRYYTISLVQSWMAISRVVLCLLYYDDVTLLFILSLLADLIGWLVAYLYVALGLAKSKSKSDQIDVNAFRKFSLWGTCHAALDLPVTQLDRMIIASFGGLELAGILNLIRRISAVLGQVADPVYQVVYPEFSNQIHNRRYNNARNISRKISVWMSVLGAISTLCAYMLFDLANSLLFSDGLVGYRLELIAAMSVHALGMVFIWIHPLFLSFGFMKDTAKIIVLANTLFVVCLCLFVEDFGVWAAIGASLIQLLVVVLAKVQILRTKTDYFLKEH